MSQAVEDAHIDTKPMLQKALHYADRTFTIIFVLEMVIKMMAYGFKKYFTDAWCWLDFVIVVVRFLSPRPLSRVLLWASCLIYAYELEYLCIEYLMFILWVHSFSTRLTSVTFAEDKVLIFLILRKNAKIVQL